MVKDGVVAGGDAPDGVVGVQLQGAGVVADPDAAGVLVGVVVGAHGVGEHQRPGAAAGGEGSPPPGRWVVAGLALILADAELEHRVPGDRHRLVEGDGDLDVLPRPVGVVLQPRPRGHRHPGDHRLLQRAPRARIRPRAVAFGVRRPHPHLVGGGLVEAGDGRPGLRHVLRAVRPTPARPLAVLRVVGLDRWATGVAGRCPFHEQGVGAFRGRRDARRSGLDRRLVPVRHVDRHRDGVRAAEAVNDPDHHQVLRLRLVVVVHPCLRAELAGARVDGEVPRVAALQGVGQRVIGVIRRREGRAQVRCAGDGRVAEILLEAPRRHSVRGEYRVVVLHHLRARHRHAVGLR